MKRIIIENRMKSLVAILIAVFCMNSAWAQETTGTSDSITARKVIIETVDSSTEKGNDEKIVVQSDTTVIRMGKKEVTIIQSGGNRHVDIVKSNHDSERKKDKKERFDGHFGGIDIGINGFLNEDYNLYNGGIYEGVDFMDLNQIKSSEINLNAWEYSIELQKYRKNIGIVTGIGLSINNYRFENPYTLKKENGILEPVLLDADKLEKSKLTVGYLTIPIMLEFQVPVNNHSNSLFIAGGIEGGLNIRSYTKIKWDDNKEKDKGDYNINTFKYSAVMRVGLKGFSLYGKYCFTPLFEAGKGPELSPFTIGVSLFVYQ